MSFFDIFCVSKVITSAHAQKTGVIFHIFPRAFKQKKIKELRPEMTTIASRGSCLKMVFVQTECSTQKDLEERDRNFRRRNTGKDPLPAVSCGNVQEKGEGSH